MIRDPRRIHPAYAHGPPYARLYPPPHMPAPYPAYAYRYQCLQRPIAFPPPVPYYIYRPIFLRPPPRRDEIPLWEEALLGFLCGALAGLII
jgi:hypothetical protein